jgi:hypothetical protein
MARIGMHAECQAGSCATAGCYWTLAIREPMTHRMTSLKRLSRTIMLIAVISASKAQQSAPPMTTHLQQLPLSGR